MSINIQFISNYQCINSHYEQIQQVIAAGIKWVQFRPKEMHEDLVLEEGRKIVYLCKQNKVKIIINDNVLLAKKLDADGVHLGKSDMSPTKAREILGDDKIIGGTANTFEDIKELLNQGVNYIGLGPYKYTETKKNLSSILGLVSYKEILRKMEAHNLCTDIVAIGGIKMIDIPLLKAVGIKNFAVSSLLSESQNIEKSTRKIMNL